MRTIRGVDTATQALLFALLGAVVGGAAVLAWRISEIQQRRAVDPPEQPGLPEGVTAVLSVLRSSAIVVDDDDVAVKLTAPARAFNLVEGGRLTNPQLLQQARLVRRDGLIRETELQPDRSRAVRHVSARVAPLGVRHVLVLLEDRTRERQVEVIRRDFVANVSHELKTPVGAIRLLAEAVTQASDDPEAVQRFAGRMGMESKRLGRLVQQIIELSRLQDDDPLEEPGTVELDLIIERVIDENGTDASLKDIHVVRDGEKGLHVLGNTDQIALALGNLVSNAVSYSSASSTVLVATRVNDEGAVEIAVTDRGIGIPAPDLDRIFERFYRVDPARHRSTGGTGLGLSIVKHVVAVHGGEVRVWSVEGQGSTFTVSLPRKQDARPDHAGHAAPDAQTHATITQEERP